MAAVLLSAIWRGGDPNRGQLAQDTSALGSVQLNAGSLQQLVLQIKNSDPTTKALQAVAQVRGTSDGSNVVTSQIAIPTPAGGIGTITLPQMTMPSTPGQYQTMVQLWSGGVQQTEQQIGTVLIPAAALGVSNVSAMVAFGSGNNEEDDPFPITVDPRYWPSLALYISFRNSGTVLTAYQVGILVDGRSVYQSGALGARMPGDAVGQVFGSFPTPSPGSHDVAVDVLGNGQRVPGSPFPVGTLTVSGTASGGGAFALGGQVVGAPTWS